MGVRVRLLHCARRLRHPARSTLVAGAALLLGWLVVDQALGRMYRSLRPGLEEEYGRALGRPLKLGSYRGLRWSGLHVGPSRVLPSGVDLTQLAADELIVSVDPWASLLQRRWVVHLHLHRLEADWRRNARGAVWTVPPDQEEPMPVELWIHTRDPARMRLWWQPGADDPSSPDLMGTFVGRMALGHRQHEMVIKGRLALASGGRLSVESLGIPLDEPWTIHGRAQGIQLEGLNPLLANTPGEALSGLSGQVDGAMTLGTARDSPCRGSVVFNNLQLPLQRIDPTGELDAMGFGPLSLGCDDGRLQLFPTDFHVGALTGRVQGSLGLDPDQPLDLRATVGGPLPPPLAALGGVVTGDLRLLGPLTAPESQVNLTVTDWRSPAAEPATGQPWPPLILQFASQWRPVEEQRRLQASLQAQAGASRVVMAGQLAPRLSLQSSAVTLQPRDWLPPDLWPDQPYTGSFTVAMDQPGATPEVRLRLRNPHLQEDFTVRLAEDQFQVDGRLELAAGQHLGINGRAEGGQWQLAANLSEMDVAPLLDGVLPLPPLWPSPLSLAATARGRYGDNPSPDVGQGSPPLQVEQAQLTARLPHGLRTPDDTLLGSAEVRLRATTQGQWAVEMEAPRLRSQGVVDWWPGRPWQEAGLDLSLALEEVSLAPLSPLRGALTLTGQLGGSPAQPRFDGELMLADPGLALIGSPRRWRGRILSLANGHGLHLAAGGEDPSPDKPDKGDPVLDVRVNSALQLQDLQFRAGDGHLDVAATEAGYRWLAQDLPLSWLQADGVELAGTLQGKGELSLGPGQIHGDVTVNGPRWGSLRSRQLSLRLMGKDHQLQLDGQLLTGPTSGELAWGVRLNQQPGTPQPWSVYGDFDAVPLGVLRQSMALTRELLQRIRTPMGSSQDLGTLVIGVAGESLATQLERLAMARERLGSLDALLEQVHNRQLQNLDGQLYGDVRIRGAADQPVWAAVRTDLQLWLVEDGVNRPLAPGHGPFHLHLEGPLQGSDAGTVQFSGLPLRLVNVLANLQLPWQGVLAGRGQHQDLLGERLVSLTLALQGGRFHHQAIRLTPATLRLKGATVGVEMALQTPSAAPYLLTVNGNVNLDGGDEAFRLRLSAGNGVMAFLPSLSDDAVAWTQGDARMMLLVRGPLEQPVFHGFLRLHGAEGRVAGVPVRNLNSVVLFDLNNLFVDQLEATVGEAGGAISGSGFLGILQPVTTDDPLTMTLEDVAVSAPNARFMASGKLVLHGSVQDPELGGDLRLSNGVIRADGNGQASAAPARPAAGTIPDNPVNNPLGNWDWREPLELGDLEGASPMERSLLQAMAELPPIDLRSLNVKLGPDLTLEAATVANFSIASTAGLTLTGTMGLDLQARGLVKLLRGQVNLFTSQFRLDPDAPNVVVFSADSGLIPYLDVTMWTQEADTGQGPGRDLAAVSAEETTGSTTAFFDNLNLVRIQAVVAGPADQFPATLRLQSRPPRSQEELLALIGGNSVNRLVQGSTNSRLFSIVGQPLVDPVLNRLGYALDQRIIFSITPTSFTPAGASDGQQATEEFVLAGELGLSVSDRVDVAVLGALNRSDLPPQAKLRVQFTPAIATEITAERGGYAKGILQFSSRF